MRPVLEDVFPGRPESGDTRLLEACYDTCFREDEFSGRPDSVDTRLLKACFEACLKG